MKRWHTIPGFERYETTVTGKIRHHRHRRVLREGVPHNGIPQVSIYSDGLQRTITKCVHHLVARVFLGDQPQNTWIRHRDGKINNNHYKNLYYYIVKGEV